jgi:hypothetical protein
MRGTLLSGAPTVSVPPLSPDSYQDATDAMVDTKGTTNGSDATAIKDNLALANQPGSIWWLMVIFVIYLFWDWYQNREGIRASLSPANIRANIHNLVVITLASVIGFNLFTVILTKLAGWRIPVISKAAGTILPLFSI